MRLSVVAATLEGCARRLIGDPAFLERVLDETIAAGGLHVVHRMRGRTADRLTVAAILSESHLAFHAWPARGVLFVDMGTCSTPAATQAAFACVRSLVPHGAVRHRRWLLESGRLARPEAPSTAPAAGAPGA